MWIWHLKHINSDAKLCRQDVQMRILSHIYTIELYLTMHLYQLLRGRTPDQLCSLFKCRVQAQCIVHCWYLYAVFSIPSNTIQTGCLQYASDSSCGRQRIMQTYSVTQLFSWCKTVIAIDFNKSVTINPIQELPSVVFGILFCGAQMENLGDNFFIKHVILCSMLFTVLNEKREKNTL